MAEPLLYLYSSIVEGMVARKNNYQQEKRRRELEKQKKKESKKELKHERQEHCVLEDNNREGLDSLIE